MTTRGKKTIENVAIVGAGPSGIFLALLLSFKGFHVTVFDPKTPWEHPMGGAILYDELSNFPAFADFKKNISLSRLMMISPKGREAVFEFEPSIQFCWRHEILEFLEKQATDNGVTIHPNKLESFERSRNGWTISAKDTPPMEFDFLIGADGGVIMARKCLGLTSLFDTKFIEVSCDLIQTLSVGGLVKYLNDMKGYFLALPRAKGTAVRLRVSSAVRHPMELLEKLDRVVQGLLHFPLPDNTHRSVAQVPINRNFVHKEICGDGWALIGDAAGFVDPTSEEGLIYGLRSAELLALSIDHYEGVSQGYLKRLDLEIISPLKKRLRTRKLYETNFMMDWMVKKSVNDFRYRNKLLNLLGLRASFQKS